MNTILKKKRVESSQTVIGTKLGYIVLGLLRKMEGSPLIVNCVTGL